MSRLFTVSEAQRLVPQLRGLVASLLHLQREKAGAERELTNISQRIMFTGGLLPRRDRLFEWKTLRERAQQQIHGTIEQIKQLGCEVKDVEEGLVDFPTLYRGQRVYLCWRLGEQSIMFWHSIAEGFAGRKPIDDEFLAQHSGDITQ